MKKQNIEKYIKDINFKTDDWSAKKIEKDLKSLIGETPAIKFNWEKDVMINEIKGEAKEYKKLESLVVVFTDIDDKIKSLEFKIEE